MQVLITVSAIISAVGAIPYIVGVVKGNVKPKIVSWFTWCLLAALLTGAALSAGQTTSAIMSAVSTLVTGIIFFLGIKKGDRSLDKLDIVSLAGAFVGICIWLLLDNPTLAIFVAVAVDIIAFIPTIVHGWTAPEEESLASYGLAAIGAGLGLFVATLANSAIAGVAYPLYSTVFNGLMIVLLTRETWVYYFKKLLPTKTKTKPEPATD